jgi:hypothetical protein
MTFPLAEVKVSSIRRETAEPRTTVLVRLYRVDDGGIVNGQQQYLRTLRRERVVKRVGVLASDAAILTALRNNVMDWLSDLDINLPPGRVICTL